MREAVIVSTARTAIAKAFRGSLNITHGAEFGGAAASAAVERSGVDPDLIEDAIFGCGLPEGATGGNIARQIAIRAGLPVTTAGLTVNRFCSSGLQAIALASHSITVEGSPAMLAGGNPLRWPRDMPIPIWRQARGSLKTNLKSICR